MDFTCQHIQAAKAEQIPLLSDSRDILVAKSTVWMEDNSGVWSLNPFHGKEKLFGIEKLIIHLYQSREYLTVEMKSRCNGSTPGANHSNSNPKNRKA